MTEILRELEADESPSAEAIDRLLETETFPSVRGTTATLVYRGEADRVLLRHWIHGLPSEQAFRRVGDSELWVLELEIPRQSRIEYKIDVVKGRRHRWIRDPLNPVKAHDPFGANSVLHGEGYEVPTWTQPDPTSRKGEMARLAIDSDVFGDRREVQLYLPARHRPRRRHPLLIVHDGEDYLRYANLQTVLDNLIERLEIEPPVVALIQSPDRLIEYGADPRHGRFLAEELLPELEAKLPIKQNASARALMGASFGAVAALAAASEHPGTFSRLLLQSGSFAFSDVGFRHDRGPAFDPVVRFMRRFRLEGQRPADRVFMSCGVYESLIYENRSLLPLMQSTGAEVRYVEARDGHNWENWRDRLREGLSWLFPGPLWMVYE